MAENSNNSLLNARRAFREEDTIDLLELVMILWHRLWLILLVGILTGSLSLVYTKNYIKPKYQAETLVYVNNNNITVGSISLSSSDLSVSQDLVSVYGVILESRRTLRAVIAETGLDYTTDQLKDMITSSAVDGTSVMSVKVTSENPEEAEQIANTIAEVLPDKIDEIIDGSSSRIIDYAIKPEQRISPSYSKNVMLGSIAGAFLVCVIVVILHLMDTRIHTEEDLREAYTDIPILASIPNSSAKSRKYGYYNKYYGERSKENDGKEK